MVRRLRETGKRTAAKPGRVHCEEAVDNESWRGRFFGESGSGFLERPHRKTVADSAGGRGCLEGRCRERFARFASSKEETPCRPWPPAAGRFPMAAESHRCRVTLD